MSFKIELAKSSDVLDLFYLANDEDVRKNSFNQNKITLEDHKKWFSEKLADKNCYFYIIRYESSFIGSMRFDFLQNNQYVVGVQVAKLFRGKGISTQIIQEVTKTFLLEQKTAKIIANVKFSNIASLKSFANAGYIRSGKSEKSGEEFYIFEYENC